jgi:enoyl-CoA hydratase/carnithine racemase
MSSMPETSTEPTTEPTVLESLEEGVLTLTLNRPDRANAWNPEMEFTYFDAVSRAAQNPDVRVVVVTGKGRTFCPGMDSGTLTASVGGQRAYSNLRRPMTFAYGLDKPLIAAINGACAGIGLIQACCADVRFVARGTKLTTAFARRGLPAENGLSWLLQRIVGTSNAADLLLSARAVTADEAKELGLVNRVYEPDELMGAVMAYARDMAVNCSPTSMANIKRQMRADADRTLDLARKDGLRLVGVHQQLDDFREGIMSYVEKRPPTFEGLRHQIAAEWVEPIIEFT